MKSLCVVFCIRVRIRKIIYFGSIRISLHVTSAWMVKNHPEITVAQITKLVGTTKPTIQAVRDRTHPNSSSIRPRHPADLGLCTYQELDAASVKGFKAQGKDPEEMKAKRLKEMEEANKPVEEESNSQAGGFDFSNFLSSGIGGAGAAGGEGDNN